MRYDLNVADVGEASRGEFDVCIVGAGAAGITLTNELKRHGYRIALCEGGSDHFSEASQDCYKGKVVGDPYLTLDGSRLRFLGGSTNHWGGWCRPFTELDFRREYLGPEYKWPIEYRELHSYLGKACDILEVRNDFDDLGPRGDVVRVFQFQFSPPVRFRGKYEKELTESRHATLFLDANLIDIAGDRGNGGGRITSARFRSYTGKEMTIRARRFVFAMGGIENSRFLLWFAQRHGNRFYDTDAPIGKYWMEHPHFTLGKAIVGFQTGKRRFYHLSDREQIRLRILGCGLRLDLQPEGGTDEMMKELSCAAPKLGKKVAALAEKNLVCGVRFRAAWEQAPVISNAVELGRSHDPFGIPRVDLHWKKQPIDRRTLNETVRVFNEWLLRDDLGRIQLRDWVAHDENYPARGEIAGNHHMGGTRMAESVRYGVVDRNCKVFGSENLYIAGSSIYTTSGFGNPTLPIVQFALRLADHLKQADAPIAG